VGSGLRLWCRPVSLRIFEKIRSQANRGRRRRNFEAECYATAVPALPCAISPYFISDGAFARALPGGLRVLADQAEPGTAVPLRARRRV